MSAPPRSVLSLYPRALPLGTRLFLAARWRLTPYRVMAARLPERGRVLDLGCGHGLLALAAALGAPERTVVGVDHDAERVKLAMEAARAVPNAAFRVGSLTAPPPGPYAGVAMIDVLHYFAPPLQEELVRQAHRLLEPGGTLLVREVEPDAGALSIWNRVYERVATGIGFTRAEGKGLHFRPRGAWERLLREAGFEVGSERCSSALFRDVLFTARRAAP